MLTDAAKRIAELADKRIDLPLGQPNFQPKDKYENLDFSSDNFQPIKQDSDLQPSGLKGRVAPPGQHSHMRDLKLACLDGGNLPVIKTPSFAVQFERVYFNCFEGSERVKLDIPNRLEFFVVVTSSAENGDIRYETQFVPLNEKFKEFLPNEGDLVFDSYDETMREGQSRMEIPRVGDIARAFAEWRYSAIIAKELDEGDILVKDGTLHAPYTNLSAYAEGAYTVARKKGVLLCGVSKTSHLYTTTGLPLVAAISRLARENKVESPWYYEKLVEITDPAHKADLNFVRLNKQSDYIFRVEILKGQEDQKDTIMSALAANSRDISFPGYPYGLVDADKRARVSFDELDALRMVLFSEFSKTGDFERFKDFLAGSEAHEWLNKVV